MRFGTTPIEERARAALPAVNAAHRREAARECGLRNAVTVVEVPPAAGIPGPEVPAPWSPSCAFTRVTVLPDGVRVVRTDLTLTAEELEAFEDGRPARLEAKVRKVARLGGLVEDELVMSDAGDAVRDCPPAADDPGAAGRAGTLRFGGRAGRGGRGGRAGRAGTVGLGGHGPSPGVGGAPGVVGVAGAAGAPGGPDLRDRALAAQGDLLDAGFGGPYRLLVAAADPPLPADEKAALLAHGIGVGTTRGGVGRLLVAGRPGVELHLVQDHAATFVSVDGRKARLVVESRWSSRVTPGPDGKVGICRIRDPLPAGSAVPAGAPSR